MLTSEFQKSFEYTKGLIRTDLASIILFLACLIPFVNFIVLMRYVDKIVSEPSTSASPPKLVNPNWGELIVSLIKIIVVAIAWVIIAVILLVPAVLAIGIGAVIGALSMTAFFSHFSLAVLGIVVYALVVAIVVGLFAILSEVNMIKNGKKIGSAFAINELINKITKIGLMRYIIYAVSFV
jgi:hypothetical protein